MGSTTKRKQFSKTYGRTGRTLIARIEKKKVHSHFLNKTLDTLGKLCREVAIANGIVLTESDLTFINSVKFQMILAKQKIKFLTELLSDAENYNG